MSNDAERIAFAVAKARFSEIFEQDQVKHKDQVIVQEGDVSLLGRFLESVTSFVRKPKVSIHDAIAGLNAAVKVLDALIDRPGTSREDARKWAASMDAAADELYRLVQVDWASRTKAYAPMTDQFKASAAALRSAKSKADQLANQLNLAADVLGAFTKLLSAFA